MKLTTRLGRASVAALAAAILSAAAAAYFAIRGEAAEALASGASSAFAAVASLAASVSRRRSRAGFGALASAIDAPVGGERAESGIAVDEEFTKGARDLGLSRDRFRTALKEMEMRVEARAADLVAAYNELQDKNESIRREMRMAQRVQKMFVPRTETLRTRPEIDFGAYYAAMESLGGDLYDVIRVGRNAYGLLVLDVSGHGVAAALVTAFAKVSFQHSSGYGVSPARTLERVNADLRATISDTDMFVTAFFAIANLETGVIQYANAGHHPPIVHNRHSGELSRLDTKGPFLGVFDDARFEESSATMVPGDRFVLFTDGIVEARNFLKEEYDVSRLEAVVGKGHSSPAGDVVEAIVADIDAFTMSAPRRDDQTLLVFDFNGVSEPHGDRKALEAEPNGDGGEEKADDAAANADIIHIDGVDGGEEVDEMIIEEIAEPEGTASLSERFDGALLAAKEGRLYDAERILRDLLLERSDKPEILNNLGVVLAKRHLRDEALLCFEKALVLAPTNARYKRNLEKTRALHE
jgi:serine phosphatase RsbU (regulator of sigma subunit)